MNRRIATTILVGGILLAVLAAAGCGGSSGSSSGSGGAPTAEDTTLTVYDTPVGSTGVYSVPSASRTIAESGQAGPLKHNGVGDRTLSNGVVLGSPSGAVVGSSTDICTTMNTAELIHCDSSLTLNNKGILFVAANFKPSDATQTFAITGGTGAYDESHGEMIVSLYSGDEYEVKIDID
jgi:hypothetical protein